MNIESRIWNLGELTSQFGHHDDLSWLPLSIDKKEILVEILYVEKSEIQALNKKYRELDEPTDILSFPLYTYEELNKGQDSRFKIQDSPRLLGSLVICQEIVDQREHGLSWTLHHGLRHLFGYDHDETGETWSPSTR